MAPRLPRELLLAVGALAPFLVAARWPAAAFGIAAAVAAGLGRLTGLVDRVTGYRAVTPYAALADATSRLRAPSLDEALPGLARAVADGTGARRAAVWLAVGERLVTGAVHPPGPPDSAANLAMLLVRPGIGHVVPVLDGAVLRAVLSIEKPELPVTPGDRVLMQDVANGAALLLRTVALNAELADRVRRADQLAEELAASRRRLARAREVERRRLLTELSRATSGRLVALREHVTAARAELAGSRTPVPAPAGSPVPAAPEAEGSAVPAGDGLVRGGSAPPAAEALTHDGSALPGGEALVQARIEVDELLDRFRVIARGVYPAVLRGHGPGAALEELVADLRRPVRLSGDLDVRVAWEIESAAYHVTAAALDVLAALSAPAEIRVRLTRADGRIRIVVEDPSPPVNPEQLRAVLVDDIERLAALGGDVECAGESALRLVAWLPDRLDTLLAVP